MVLTVLYDARCGLCRRARTWLESQAQILPLEFVAAGSEEARRRFPELDAAATLNDLTVVGDRGEVFLGANAWLMCLWALRSYRELAMRLSAPALQPVARRFVCWIAKHRLQLGASLR